jgi:four helix bundle protein
MNAKALALQERTLKFGVRMIELSRKYPRTPAGDTVSRQLVKAGTSVGANYRAVCRSRSSAEFSARMGVVLEEADEGAYWLALTERTNLVTDPAVTELQAEARELAAIFASSILTIKRRP